MGMRELLILILILAIIGIILRGLYLALRARRGQLKIALEKNVPEYDLEEIELRELPNGGARVVERSFAHVQQENQRFAGKKSQAAHRARTAKAARTSAKTAAVKSASPGSGSPQSIPVLMNSVSTGASGAASARVSPRDAEKAKEPPLIMDDLISALEDELDEQLEADQPDRAFQDSAAPERAANARSDRDDRLDQELNEELEEMLDIQQDLSQDRSALDGSTAYDAEGDGFDSDDADLDRYSSDEDLDSDDDLDAALNEELERDQDDIGYMEPTRIELEILDDEDQPEVDAIQVSAEPPVLNEPVLTEKTSLQSGAGDDNDNVTARQNAEADGHYNDDTETNYDSYAADQNIEEQSYAEISDEADDLEEVFISNNHKNTDIFGDFDSTEIDDFDDEVQQRRGELAASSGSAVSRLKGWGAKLFGTRSSDAGNEETARGGRQGERGVRRARQQSEREHDNILFDAPLKNSADELDDFDSDLGPVRESPRAPQQQSLLRMEDEGAPLADEPALHAPEKPFADKSIPKYRSQAEKAAQAVPGRAREAATGSPASAQTATTKARADAEAARVTHNNNIAPDYSEVLIVNVMARGDSEFAGVDLLPAMLSSGLRFGEMNIFHRHVDDRGTGPVLFSVANILNPGTFNLNEINSFSTRGVCFFLTLPNVINNMQAFDRMIDTAQKLRSALDGEMKDDNRSVMTAQTIEHYRQRIRDFELRQLRQH